MTNRQTSDEISSLAGRIMAKGDPFTDPAFDSLTRVRQDAMHDLFDDWVQSARRLAGSALSQDETPGKRVTGKHPALGMGYGRDMAGRESALREITDNMRAKITDFSDTIKLNKAERNLLEAFAQYADQIDAYRPAAGTSAYEMVATAERQNVETTETMIHMVAATVLMIQVERQAPVVQGGEVSFSPADMDAMHRNYQMTAKRDGMVTTVRIEPRAVPLPSLTAEPGIDETPAEPQVAEHVYDKPLWAVRVNGFQHRCRTRQVAESVAETQARIHPNGVIQVENVDHYDAEVASAPVDTPENEA